MSNDINKMLAIWNGDGMISKEKMVFPSLNLEEIVGSVFTAGPTYYYIINFHDRSLSNVSESIRDIHGFDPQTVTLTDILNAIHPDDMEHVSKAEAFWADSFFNDKKMFAKATFYKTCYSFRFRTADGSYKLFLHQQVTLSIDESGKIAISLNIHTDISHLTTENNYKVSFIGLKGEPSFMNLSYSDTNMADALETPTYTKRELEIIKALAKGKSSKIIAEELFIAFNTVKNHRKNILEKSNCTNVAELVKSCIRMGLI